MGSLGKYIVQTFVWVCQNEWIYAGLVRRSVIAILSSNNSFASMLYQFNFLTVIFKISANRVPQHWLCRWSDAATGFPSTWRRHYVICIRHRAPVALHWLTHAAPFVLPYGASSVSTSSPFGSTLQSPKTNGRRCAVFCDVTPCGSYNDRRFEGTYRLHHQRWKESTS
jgi:hypothetical protein